MLLLVYSKTDTRQKYESKAKITEMTNFKCYKISIGLRLDKPKSYLIDLIKVML